MSLQMPYNEAAEQALLGAMLLDADAADDALDSVATDELYFDKHRTVFQAIHQLRTDNRPLDLVSVTDTLRAGNRLGEIGGAGYISTLANSCPASVHWPEYAAQVRRDASFRRIMTAANRALEQAATRDEATLDNLMKAVNEADAMAPDAQEPVTYAELASQYVDVLEERHRTKQPVTGIATGFADLDDMTSGLQPGEMTILGARPSMGKSALARCIAEHAAIAGKGVLYVILEDTALNLIQRSMSAFARIPSRNLRRGWIREEDWSVICRQMQTLAVMPIHVLGPANISIRTIRRAAKNLARVGKLDLIVVDYLQLVRPAERRDSRYLEVTDTSRALKALANECHVPLLALAQLNRDCERTADKRPSMSNLRESGDIEQDADCVLLLYREEYYFPGTENQHVAELIVEKQRNGPTGTIKLYFDEQFTAFANLEKGDGA